MKDSVYGLSLAAFVFAMGCSGGYGDGADGSVAQSEEALARREGALAQIPLLCSTDKDCPKTAYCATPPGKCGGLAVCRSRPELCPEIFKPVCGCDGRTYPSACSAAAAHVSVSADGACPKVLCGGVTGAACPGVGQCVDDSSDDCDPENGGADCGGVCECVQKEPCKSGSHFNGWAEVCACVPDVMSEP